MALEQTGPFGAAITELHLEVGQTTIYALANGTLFASSDGGARWDISFPLDKLDSIFLIDGILCGVATADALLFSSDDGGMSWSQVKTAFQYVSSLLKVESTLYAAVCSGVYGSNNEGATWLLSNSGLPKDIGVLSLASLGPNLYAGTTKGLYKSSDGGDGWMLTGLNEGSIGFLLLEDTLLYAISDSSKILQSPDGARTWGVIKLFDPLVVDGSTLFVASTSGVMKLSLPQAPR